MNKNYVLIRKSGKFYNVFDDDAYIFNYLFNYNIINYKVGFPESAYKKVINKLEECSINYIVLGTEKIEKTFKNKNKYKRYLEHSKINNKFEMNLKELTNKLEKFSYEELVRITILLEREIKNEI